MGTSKLSLYKANCPSSQNSPPSFYSLPSPHLGQRKCPNTLTCSSRNLGISLYSSLPLPSIIHSLLLILSPECFSNLPFPIFTAIALQSCSSPSLSLSCTRGPFGYSYPPPNFKLLKKTVFLIFELCLPFSPTILLDTVLHIC